MGGGYATRGDNSTLMFFQDMLLDETYISLKRNKQQILLEDFIASIQKQQFNYEKIFEERLIKLKERDQNWDIKVCSYISDHRYDARLFNDINHPGNMLMKYICDEIIKILGCDTVETSLFGMGAEIPVNQFYSDHIIVSDKVRNDNVEISLTGKPFKSYEDYVRQYIWLMYDDYLE